MRATPRPSLLVRELPPVHAFGHRRAGWQSLIVSLRTQGQAREHARPSLRRRLHRSPHSPCRERKGGRRCRPLACRGALVLLVPRLRALRAARALSLRTSRLLRGEVGLNEVREVVPRRASSSRSCSFSSTTRSSCARTSPITARSASSCAVALPSVQGGSGWSEEDTSVNGAERSRYDRRTLSASPGTVSEYPLRRLSPIHSRVPAAR